MLTLTQSTYDGILYNVDTIKEMLDGKIDTLHFDEAWLPHATFHELLPGHACRSAENRPRCKESMVFSTQSTHKLLAGLSQASQILVQDSEKRKLDRHSFNEAYLMHTSTSPQYAIIASCDVAAAMMEPPGGTRAGRGVDARSDRLPARHAQGRCRVRQGLVVQGVGAGATRGREGIGNRDDWMLRANERWHGFGDLAPGFNMLDPIKATVITPGLDVSGAFAESGHTRGGGDQVSGGARHHRGEDRALFVLHHVHDRHHQGPMEHAGDGAAAVQGRLRQQPAAVARAAGVPATAPAVREGGAARFVRRRSTASTRRTTWRGSPPRCICPTWSRR